MNKGRVYIISGPSGSGKDTVLKGIFAQKPEINFSISSITREMRPGEVEGEKYNFISREKFEQMLANGDLLEHNVFVDNYYGTPKAPVIKSVDAGQDIIIEVDVNGKAQIKEKMPEAVSIFIMPPSLEVLKQRLCARGTDSPEVIEKRLKEALREIAQAPTYDYIVVNDIVENAVEAVLKIVSIDCLKADRNIDLVNKVLNGQ